MSSTTTIRIRISPTGGSANNYYLTGGNNALILNGTITALPVTTVPVPSTTTAASSVTESGFNSGGTITSDGGSTITVRGIVSGTSTAPTGNATSNGNTVGAYTSSASGLTANTRYYFRSYATNGVGTGYGPELSTITLPNAPTVGSGTLVGENGFTANWAAPSGGPATYTYQVDVSENTSFSPLTTSYTSISSGSLSTLVSGLTASTIYYFRVMAVNASGNSA